MICRRLKVGTFLCVDGGVQFQNQYVMVMVVTMSIGLHGTLPQGANFGEVNSYLEHRSVMCIHITVNIYENNIDLKITHSDIRMELEKNIGHRSANAT